MKLVTIKGMMSEKTTTLLSLKNPNWKTVKLEKNKRIINTHGLIN